MKKFDNKIVSLTNFLASGTLADKLLAMIQKGAIRKHSHASHIAHVLSWVSFTRSRKVTNALLQIEILERFPAPAGGVDAGTVRELQRARYVDYYGVILKYRKVGFRMRLYWHA